MYLLFFKKLLEKTRILPALADLSICAVYAILM